MDRVRAGSAGGTVGREDPLTHGRWTLGTLVLTAGCSILSPDFDRVIGLQIGSTLVSVAVGDTVRLEADAIDARGGIVPDVAIVWSVLDTLPVGIALDSVTGLVTGLAPDTVRVQARLESIRSDPVTVTVFDPAPPPTTTRGRRT